MKIKIKNLKREHRTKNKETRIMNIQKITARISDPKFKMVCNFKESRTRNGV